MRRLSLLLIVVFAANTWGVDWPTFRQNNYRNAVTLEKLDVPKLGVNWVWQSIMPPQPAWYGPAKWDAYAGIRGLRSMRNYDPVFHPIVAKGCVYFGSSANDSIHCVDLISGKEKWVQYAEGPVRVAPSWYQGRIYFGSDDGYAYCLDAKTGKLIWKFRPKQLAATDRRIVNNGRLISMWPCRTGVVVFGGTAYCAFSLLPWQKSYLCAIDAATGNDKGSGRFVHELANHTMEGPLLLSPNRIIVPQGRVEPHLFSRKDGKSLGKLKGGGGSFVVLTPDSLILHGPGNKTGWIRASKAGSRETVATYRNGNAIVVAGRRSYLLTDHQLVASDWLNRKVLWKSACRFPFSMIVSGKYVIVGGQDEVAGFDADSGKIKWSHPVSGKVFGLAAAAKSLLVSTDRGLVYSFRSGKEQPKRQTDQPTARVSGPLTKIQPVKVPGLVGRWVFQSPHVGRSQVKDLAGKLPGTISGSMRFERIGGYEALRFGTVRCTIAANHNQAKLPKKDISAAAWVMLDRAKTWGSIIGAIQDNGSYERGWLLGNRGNKFCFAVASRGGKGQPKLTYMTAPKSFETGKWYHVAGTYDGKTMKLAVNGKVVATSTSQSGDILYPPQAFYEIGAYHDKDENFPMEGQIHEVQVFNRSLSISEIAKLAAAKKFAASDPYEVAVGPVLKFTAMRSAQVWWESAQATETWLELSLDGKVVRELRQVGTRKHHRVTINQLKPNRYYTYTIARRLGGKKVTSRPFECDMFFNYQTPKLTAKAVPSVPSLAKVTSAVLKRAPHSRGLSLIVGGGKGVLATTLARRSQMRVVIVERDTQTVAQLRKRLRAMKIAAARVSVVHVKTYDKLPFTDGVFNSVVSEEVARSGGLVSSFAELTRVLSPKGLLLLGQSAKPAATITATQLRAWVKGKAKAKAQVTVAQVTADTTGIWVSFIKPPPAGAGEWSHLYGTPANAAFGGEALSGAASAKDLEVQWIGRPGSRYQADRNGRKPSPLSTNGRLFLQGLRRLIGLDSYNGTILWSLELPQLKRFNMPRDCSNWCADPNSLFVAIDRECWQIDAATGAIKHRHSVSTKNAGSQHWGFVARKGSRLIGSSVRKGAQYSSFWGGAAQGWYDAKSGPATFKVCSDRLFSIEVGRNQKTQTNKTAWEYNGLIVNSTITLGKSRVFFVECRSDALKVGKARRLGGKDFWGSLYFVALDQKTGKRQWEQKLKTAAGTVVYFLAFSEGHLSLVASSSDRKYHVHVFDAASGKKKWNTSYGWPSDNHGGHMSRPAIVGKTLYVRPRAFELTTGLVLSRKMPHGSCGTYACTKDAMFFRSGNVTVWDRKRGGVTKWNRLRPDCWLSTIPAGGMLLSPEGGGGCSCGSWIETSIGFSPKRR